MEKVPGLIYLPQFIPKHKEIELIQEINSWKWNTSLKRRTQHFGYRYSYDKANTLEEEAPIPPTLQPIKQMIEAEIFKQTERNYVFDQLIINEYEPGQGISGHIDNKVLFDDIIAGLSIGSQAVMRFEKNEEKYDLMLERRSLLILSGQARESWKHSIPSRKKDGGLARGLRLSLTWRRLKQEVAKRQQKA